MKKIYYLYFAAVVMFLVQSCKKTEPSSEKGDYAKILSSGDKTITLYYWSLKQKIFLSEDTSAFIILPEDSSELLRRLENIDDSENFQRLKSGYYLVRNQSFSFYKKAVAVGNIQPVFKSVNEEELVPTGDILILPLAGVSIAEVLKTTKASLIIVSQSGSGRYVARVQSRASILDISNAIYESGKVTYCHPDFIANIKQ